MNIELEKMEKKRESHKFQMEKLLRSKENV